MKEVSKKEPLISVIIPVYKVEEYLDKCVSSVIEQTYKNLEIILVDDGSPDNCPKMCDDWAKKDNRIKVIHKKNGGVSSARNIGIKESKGKWITFIDSDDWVETTFIYDLYRVSINEKCDIALSGYNRVVGVNSEEINANGELTKYTPLEFLTNVLNPQTGFGFCHMKLIRTECIKNVRFDEELKVTEDAFFNLQLVDNINNVCLLNKALYNYRINENSVVKKFDSKYPDKYLKGIKVIKNYLFKKYDDNIKQNYYNFVVYHVMLIAVNYCYSDNINNKRKSLIDICKIDEFKEGIKKSNYNYISLTRKITLFSIKYKLYFLTGLICRYRQRQNRSK